MPLRPSRIPLLLALPSSVCLLAACQPSPPIAPSVSALQLTQDTAWVRSELYFGQDRRDGTPIDDADWRAFVDAEVTPRFPAGLTVLSAEGQYRDAAGVLVRESSRVLVVLVPMRDCADADDALDAIADAWCERFDQESVLRVDMPVGVTFETAP